MHQFFMAITRFCIVSALSIPFIRFCEVHATDSVLTSTVITPKKITAPDSLAKSKSDSTKQANVRASLKTHNARHIAAIISNTQHIDSVFPVIAIPSSSVYTSDASGLAEILKTHPFYVYLPLTLSSSQNRLSYMGLAPSRTTIASALHNDTYTPSQALAADIISASEISRISMVPGGTLEYSTFADSLVSPHTIMRWESGVFNENALTVRFVRPLAKTADIAIFSNFRNFDRGTFNHRNGGMRSFYNGIYTSLNIDTALVSNTGKTPLTHEQSTGLSTSFKLPHNASIGFLYHYMDLHNDEPFEAIDSSTQTQSLHWQEQAQYIHRAGLLFKNVQVGTYGRIGASANIRSMVNRIFPLTLSDANLGNRRGSSIHTVLSIDPSLCFTNDTFSVTIEGSSENTTHYNEYESDITRFSAVAHWQKNIFLANAKLAVLGSMGYATAWNTDTTRFGLVGNASVVFNYNKQIARLYIKRDLPTDPTPFDSTDATHSSLLFPNYFSLQYGLETGLYWKQLGILLGVVSLTENNATSGNGWPRTTLPAYQEPTTAFAVAPVFGRWHGLALQSSFIFADKTPYMRIRPQISYAPVFNESKQKLNLELTADYWTKREIPAFGGDSTWGRPLLDVSFKMAIQIQSFRIFYRIDNLINREYAYIPGYYLPGLTFRWGFNWLLPG
jgi:hypothetical protein